MKYIVAFSFNPKIIQLNLNQSGIEDFSYCIKIKII